MSATGQMAELSVARNKSVIDEAHLGRMTLGDRSLEREVLEIFARQTVLMLERIVAADPARAAAAAHTLKGSASGIGAWRVARAAEKLELAASAGLSGAAIGRAVAELEAAGQEVRAAIGERLAKPLGEAPAGTFSQRPREH